MVTARDRRWLTLALTLLTISALWTGAASAGRPLETEDTGTLEPGRVDLELSGDWVRDRAEDVWVSKATLVVGVAPRLELQLETPYLVREPDEASSQSGVGDLILGGKYRLLDERSHVPAVLVALALRLPTGDPERGLGDEGVDVGGLAVVSKTLGPATLTLDGGYTVVSADRTLDAWTVGGSVVHEVTRSGSLVAEAVATFRPDAHETTLLVRAGGVYAVTDGLALDAAVAAGVTRDSPDVIATLGLTWSF